MKPILFSILFLFVPKLAISQISENNKLELSENDKVIYLDSKHKETKSNDYKFYRIIKDYKLAKDQYTVLEYNKSGILQTELTSTSKKDLAPEGQYINYYENGNKKTATTYIKSRPNGKTVQWYENGNKKLEGEYISDEKKTTLKINQFWNTEGIQKMTGGSGEYEENEKGYFGFGSMKDGVKNGVWKGSMEKPNIKFTENYKDGQFISGKSLDENNIETTYNVLEKKPEPKNGIMEFYQYIGKNYKKPNVAGLSGKIQITFVVDIDGTILEPTIIRDLGYGTGQEALRILQNYNNFIPGELRGQKVRLKYNLPITIQASPENTNSTFR